MRNDIKILYFLRDLIILFFTYIPLNYKQPNKTTKHHFDTKWWVRLMNASWGISQNFLGFLKVAFHVLFWSPYHWHA
jgi:hypothetical protein